MPSRYRDDVCPRCKWALCSSFKAGPMADSSSTTFGQLNLTPAGPPLTSMTRPCKLFNGQNRAQCPKLLSSTIPRSMKKTELFTLLAGRLIPSPPAWRRKCNCVRTFCLRLTSVLLRCLPLQNGQCMIQPILTKPKL